MTNVMDAWPSGATLSGPSQTTSDAAKRVLHCVAPQHRSSFSAEEEAGGIAPHNLIALGDIQRKRPCCAPMQRNASRLAELALPYRQQLPIQIHIAAGKTACLRQTQSRGNQQREECHIRLGAKSTTRPHAARLLQ